MLIISIRVVAHWIEKKRVAPRLKMALNGLKALWHDASVKPEGNAVILYQWLDDRGTMDVGIDGVFSDVEWAKFVAYNRITKWCYIEDLLPKGGEK